MRDFKHYMKVCYAFVILFILLLSACTQQQTDNSTVDKGLQFATTQGYQDSDSALVRSRQLANEGESREALDLLLARLNGDDLIESYGDLYLKITMLAGNLYYTLFDLDSSFFYWNKTIIKAEEEKKFELLASVQTNIGNIYLQKKYTHSALQYFLEAKKTMEDLGLKDENYYITCFNIAVAQAVLQQFDEADFQLELLKNVQSPRLKLLYYLNKSDLGRRTKNSVLFEEYLDSANQFLSAYGMFKGIYDMHILESALELEIPNLLDTILIQHASDFVNKDLKYIIQFNRASLLQNKRLAMPLEAIFALEDTLLNVENYSLLGNYYLLLSEYYTVRNDSKNQLLYLQKLREIDKLREERNRQIMLNDFASSGYLAENKVLKAENTLISVKLKRQQEIYITGTVFLIFVLSILLLVYHNTRKSNALAKSQLEVSRLAFKELELRRKQVEEHFKFQQKRLQRATNNIKKLAILRKQLEHFFDTFEQETTDKQSQQYILKKAKLDFNSFFSNYQDLAVMAFSDEQTMVLTNQLKKQHCSLTNKELMVLTLILSNYTSSEMALLLDKSLKNIEYQRTQIRKKLAIPQEVTIVDYCSNLIKEEV